MIKALLPQSARRAIKGWVESLRGRVRGRLTRHDLYRFDTPERVGLIFSVDSPLETAERMLLYSLVRGIRPQRVLEIGTSHGGSASIIAAALEDVGRGIIVGLDPAPQLTTDPRRFYGRFRLISKPCPEALPEARSVAGGPFDLVLWDSIQIHDQIKKDLEAVVSYLAEEAYILVNNPFHYGIAAAVREVLSAHTHLHDCGFLCNTVDTFDPLQGHSGLQLLRVSPERISSPQRLVEQSYREIGRPAPKIDPQLYNHDVWYCRCVTPCPACGQKHAASFAGQNGEAAKRVASQSL